MLLECNELEDTLLEYSQTHFARAEGSKFTQELLNQMLQYNGLTPFGDQITQDKAIDTLHHFAKPTMAILKHLKRKVPPPETNNPKLDYSTLIEGIKNGQRVQPHPPQGDTWAYIKPLQNMSSRRMTNQPPHPALQKD